MSHLSSLRLSPANEGQRGPFLILNLVHLFSFGRVGRSEKAEENCVLSPEKRRIHTAYCIQSHGCSDRVTDQPARSVLNPRAVLPQAGVGDQGLRSEEVPLLLLDPRPQLPQDRTAGSRQFQEAMACSPVHPYRAASGAREEGEWEAGLFGSLK